MANERETNVKLKYTIDEAALKRVDKANADLDARLASLSKSTAAIGDAASQSGEALRTAFADGEKSASKLTQRLTEAKRKADELSRTKSNKVSSFDSLRDDLLGGGGGSRSGLGAEQLKRTGGALSALGGGDIGGAVSRLGDLQELQKEFTEIGSSLTGLPGILGKVASQGSALAAPLGGTAAGFGAILAVAGPLALAVGIVALGVDNLNKQLEGSKEAVASAISSVNAYYTAIDTGTTESLKKQLEALKKRQADEQAQLDLYQNARANAFKREQEARGDATARLLFSIGEGQGVFKDIDDQIAKLKKSTLDSAGQIAGLERALGSSAVATNDAKEAEARLAEARVKSAEQGVQREIEFTQLRRKGTADEVQARIDSLNDEKAAKQKAITELQADADKDPLGPAAKKIQEFKDRIKDIDSQIPELAGSVLAQAKANDEQKKAAEGAKQAAADYSQSLERTDELTQRAARAQRDFNDETARIARDRARGDLRESQDTARRNAREGRALALSERREAEDITRDRAKRLAAILKESDQSEVEARQQDAKDAAKFRLDQQRATADHFDKLADIERNRLDAVFDAATNLDATAVFRAQRDALRATQSEDRDFGKNQSRAAEDEQQREQEAAQQRAVERENRLKAFQEQLADEDAERAIAQARRAEDRAIKVQEDTEDRAIAKARRAEDRAIQDADRKASRDKQIADEQEALKKEADFRKKTLAAAAKDEEAFWKGFAADATTALDSARQALARFKNDAASAGGSSAPSGGSTGSGGGSRTTVVRTVTVKTSTQTQRRNLLDGFAEGGDPPLGRPVMVGELGAEAVVFKDPARVISADQTRQALSSFGGQRGGNRSVQIGTLSIPVTLQGGAGSITLAQIQQAVVDAIYEAIPETIGGVG